MAEHSPAASSQPLSTRLLYGIGGGADGIKLTMLNFFLLFYYQQVLGLDGLLAGSALVLCALLDAVTDPLTGMLSDSTRSRLGRRHPYIFVSIIPMWLSLVALFSPPAELSQWSLFLWLLGSNAALRIATTLFAIPHIALVGELESDALARGRLSALRVGLSAMAGTLMFITGFALFLRPSAAYPVGQLDPSGYPSFALLAASFACCLALVSGLGTLRPALGVQHQGKIPDQRGARQMLADARRVLRLRPVRLILAIGFFAGLNSGHDAALAPFIATFFWGFEAQQIALYPLSILVATAISPIFVPLLFRRVGRRRSGLLACLLVACSMPSIVGARLLGILPGDGSTTTLFAVLLMIGLMYVAIITVASMNIAFLADCADLYDVEYGQRQEGLLQSIMMFLQKSCQGIGAMAASLVIKVTGLAPGVDPNNLPASSMTLLGGMYITTSLVAAGCIASLLRRYPLTESKHAELLRQLREREP